MSFQKLCLLSDLSEGSGREFLLDGQIIAVFRLQEAILAVDGMCAHQGGPIASGSVCGYCVTCPWHGWQYDLRSGANLLTQKKMLATFAVETRGQEVWIDLSTAQ